MINIKEEPMTSVERFLTAIDLKEPDRVPNWPLIDYLPARYYNITVEELIYDPVKSQKAYEWLYHELGGTDIATAGGTWYMLHKTPFPFGFSQFFFDWRLPGRQLHENAMPQLFERSDKNPIVTVEDYDRIIEEGFIWAINFKNARLRDLPKLSPIGNKVIKNTKRWWDYYKVPTFTDGGSFPPFEMLSLFRGSTNFMKDIYRHPEKIKEVCDFMLEGMIAIGEYGPTKAKGKTILLGAVRGSADFISEKHFLELYWPHFKIMAERYLKDGFIVQLHMDTNWTPRLEYLRELPKGKIYLHMDERTDIFKAKEILGDRMCIQGNIKPSLFTLGTPHMIEKKVKEIIDKCGDGGGLMVGSEIPDDAKLENVKALLDTCKEYGKYKK